MKSIGTIDRRVVVGFLAIALPLVLFDLKSGSYETPRWVAIYSAAAGIIAAAAAYLAREGKVRIGWPEAGAAAFIFWAGLSILWTPDRLAAVPGTINLIALAAVALAVRHMPSLQRAAPMAVTLGVLTALAAWLFMPAAGVPYLGHCIDRPDCHVILGFGNENVAAIFLLAALPFIFATGRAWLYPLAAGVVVYLILFNGSKTEYLVLAAMSAAYLVGWQWHKMLLFGVPAGAGILMLLPQVSYSLTTRLEIVFNTAAMWLDKPLFGWGWGSFVYAYPKFSESHVWLLGPKTALAMNTNAGAAHNELAQVAAELGIVGMGIAVAIIVGVVRQAKENERPRGLQTDTPSVERAAAASLFIIGICSLVHFPLQQPATAMLAAVGVGIVLRRAPSKMISVSLIPRLLAPAAAVAAVVFVVSVGPRLYLATAHGSYVKMMLDKKPENAFANALSAYHYWPYPPQTRQWLWASVKAWNDALSKIKVRRVTMAPKSMDIIYRRSLTASPDFALLLRQRIEYLFSSGRYLERKTEVDATLAKLKRYSALHPETWLLEAQWALVRQDRRRFDRALTQAELRSGKRPGLAHAIRQLAALAKSADKGKD